MNTQAPSTLRPQLGDFSSIICFRACVKGIEQALGHRAAMVALRAAGRQRGRDLVASLGLTGSTDVQGAAAAMKAALGPDGTKLCIVERIDEDGEVFTVYLSETVCSAGEPQGADTELSFTYGAVQGALEALTGQRLRGKQVGSILRGQDHDILRFTVFA